jgi:hypothetical protein
VSLQHELVQALQLSQGGPVNRLNLEGSLRSLVPPRHLHLLTGHLLLTACCCCCCWGRPSGSSGVLLPLLLLLLLARLCLRELQDGCGCDGCALDRVCDGKGLEI